MQPACSACNCCVLGKHSPLPPIAHHASVCPLLRTNRSSCIPAHCSLLCHSLLVRAPVAMAVHERGDDAAIDYAREGAVGSGY